jgi:gas vesicle protein
MEEATLVILLAASLGGTCLGGIVSYFLCKPKSSKLLDDIDQIDKRIQDMENYQYMLKDVKEEKAKIFEAMKNISPTAASALSYARFTIFSPDIESYQKCTQERGEDSNSRLNCVSA